MIQWYLLYVACSTWESSKNTFLFPQIIPPYLNTIKLVWDNLPSTCSFWIIDSMYWSDVAADLWYHKILLCHRWTLIIEHWGTFHSYITMCILHHYTFALIHLCTIWTKRDLLCNSVRQLAFILFTMCVCPYK